MKSSARKGNAFVAMGMGDWAAAFESDDDIGIFREQQFTFFGMINGDDVIYGGKSENFPEEFGPKIS